MLGSVAVASFGAAGFAAEIPTPQLRTILPTGGQAGTQVELTVSGADLDEAKALVFSHPGLTAAPKEKKFLVKIAPDVPPAIYDVQVSGALGVSNPRAFVVGDLPEKAKPAGNSSPETAAEIAIGSTINGESTAATADFYKLSAKAGQRLMIECASTEIDSKMVPILTVLDANRREVEVSNRSGLLDFTPQTDGTYFLKVHDLTFAGGADYSYRLTVSTGPHIDYVLPPCGKPGTKAKFALYGRNLPGGVDAAVKGADGKPLQRAELEIELPAKGDTGVDGLLNPAGAAVDGFSYRLKSPGGISNATFIGFSAEPIVKEAEPNDRPGQAQKITPPCEVAGQFFPAGDVDEYQFEAKKGDIWWIEVISARLDLPTNPFVMVEREAAMVSENYGADTNIGGTRFHTASNDPAFRFEAKEDGTYRLKLRDLFNNNRHEPRSVYRLIVRKAAPDFALVALNEAPPETKTDKTATPRGALLRSNGTLALKVLAFRRDGFAGEVELHAEGLPAGVTCTPTQIPPGATEGVLLLTGANTPAPRAGTIRVIGKAKAGEHELVHEARGGTIRWAVADNALDSVRPRLARDIAIGVTAEPAPISIAPADAKRFTAKAGAKLEIPLKIARKPEFKEALKLKAFGAQGIETAKEIDVAANAATATATIDLASAKIPAGEHTIHFEAQTKGKFRGKDVVTTIYSAAIPISVEAVK